MTETKKEELTTDTLIQMATRYIAYLGKPSNFDRAERSIALDSGVVRLIVETDGHCSISQSDNENTLLSDEEGLNKAKDMARHYIDRAQALKESPFTRLKFDDCVPLSEHAERIRQATKALKD